MSSRMHMNESRNNHPRRRRKRVRPIARVTSYDVNVQYDLRRKQDCMTGKGTSHGLFAKPLHEESYNVLEGEILMSLDKSKRYMDGNIHCFSFANGLGDDVSPSVLRALADSDLKVRKRAMVIARYQILSRLTYSGVAVTPFYTERNSYQDMMQGFVSNVGGLNTLVNTGESQIRPGDIITVDLPPNFKFDADSFNKYKKHEGIPLDKLLFATNVYRPRHVSDMVHELVKALSPNELEPPAGEYDPTSENGKVKAMLKELSTSSNDAPALKKLASFILEAKRVLELVRDNAAIVGGTEKQKMDADEQLILSKGLGVVALTQLALDPELGLRMMLDLSHSVSHLYRRMIIGTALSQARKGETFDIVLAGSVDA